MLVSCDQFIFFGFTRLYQALLGLMNRWPGYVANWLIELIRLIDESLHAGLLSARSWPGQPVHTTTLYKPTKCQNVSGGGSGTASVGVGCKELTLSNHCQLRGSVEREAWEGEGGRLLTLLL